MMLLKVFLISWLTWSAPRTVMVQLFEWPWLDIAQECEDYLGPVGVAAVQVSPPHEHISLGQNAWWERYQPVSYKIISRSGTESEFKEMVQRCKKAGVDIYSDVVMNHMAAIPTGGVGIGGTAFQKYNHQGLYSPQDFHYCGRNGNNEIKNYKDRYEVQFCELLGLADLKTESEYVRNTLADYLNHLLDLGVTGFRVDAAKHMPADDVEAILSRVKRPAYVISETFIGYKEPVNFEEYMHFGDINFFPYAFDLGHSFKNNTINHLPQLIATYPSSSEAVIFLENHDLQRISSWSLPPSYEDPQLYKLTHIFMLTWPYGYPQIFSGYRFEDYDQGPPVDRKRMTTSVFDSNGECRAPWTCEHRLPWMAALIRFRNDTNRAFYTTNIWRHEKDRLAYSRGRYGFVAINLNPSAWNQSLPTDLADGHYCDVLSGGVLSPANCLNWIEVRGGKAHVNIPGRSAVVLLSTAMSRVR